MLDLAVSIYHHSQIIMGFGVSGSDPYALFSVIRYSDPSDA